MLFPKQKTVKKRKAHPKSILHDKEDRTCYLCMLLDGNNRPHIRLHEHHIFQGDPNRTHSETYGLKVYLCPAHHTEGKFAVHSCKETRELLQKIAQREFQEHYPDKDFRKIFGRNYLWQS